MRQIGSAKSETFSNLALVAVALVTLLLAIAALQSIPTASAPEASGHASFQPAGVVHPSPSLIPVNVSVAVAPRNVTLGTSVTFYLNWTGNASGSYQTNRSWQGLPPGCASANVSVLTCAPTQPGVYLVTANTTLEPHTDIGGGASTTSWNKAKLVVYGPLAPAIALSRTNVDAGELLWVNVTVSGGNTSRNDTYSYSGLPPGCTSKNISSLQCTPISNGSYRIRVNVSQLGESTANATANLTVYPPFSLTIAFWPPYGVAGQVLTIYANASGGRAPYTWSYAALPPGCAPVNASSLSCAPSQVGRFNITVTVTDHNGGRVSANRTLSVFASAPGGGSGSGTSNNPLMPLLLDGGVALALILGGVAVYLATRKRSSGRRR